MRKQSFLFLATMIAAANLQAEGPQTGVSLGAFLGGSNLKADALLDTTASQIWHKDKLKKWGFGGGLSVAYTCMYDMLYLSPVLNVGYNATKLEKKQTHNNGTTNSTFNLESGMLVQLATRIGLTHPSMGGFVPHLTVGSAFQQFKTNFQTTRNDVKNEKSAFKPGFLVGGGAQYFLEEVSFGMQYAWCKFGSLSHKFKAGANNIDYEAKADKLSSHQANITMMFPL